ncbi:MAG: sigma-54-dependent Fis family transcriptional regulator [Planctomycetes bacterium]|nr:sigma-54-dependent Fis family transcriptional regulator [Planctomycetota bacterium]
MMFSLRRLLIADPEASFLHRLREILGGQGYDVEICQQPEAARRLLEKEKFDVLVASLAFHGRPGLAWLGEVRKRYPGLPVITVATPAAGPLAVESAGLGAWGCLLKPFSPIELLDLLQEMESEEKRSRPPPSPDLATEFYGMIGIHPAMQELFRLIRNASALSPQTPILIQGESGTGKELVARALHRLANPDAATLPFIGLNCGAFSRSLLEDQLFGHVKGAFTGAHESKEGVFAAAGCGTLFLDEITEMDQDLQVKLLRAIQQREVVPLGSNQAVPWQARLIAATNRELSQEMEGGRFRRDLYYRINVIRLLVPPLRERMEDLPLLVDHFLKEFAGESGKGKKISPPALELLYRYDYPGNVRELRNLLERACFLGSGEILVPEDLPAPFRASKPAGFKSLAAVEREHILHALRLARGKKVQAARHLNIDRNRLYRMIRKYKIRPEEIQQG